MSNRNPILDSIRILPKDTPSLDRKVGSNGEIFLDRDTHTLRLFDGQVQGGYSLAKTDLSNIAETAFVSLASKSGVFGPNINIHNTTVNANSLSGDKDYVTFTVGTNDITALYLTKYVGVDLIAFFAIQEGDAWTAGVDVNQMLTYSHFGPGDPGYDIGDNILATGGVVLSANTTYTMWIQQTGSNITEYAFSTNPYWIPETANLPANYSGDPANPTVLYQDGAGQGGGESLTNGSKTFTLNADGTVSLSDGGKVGNVQGLAQSLNGVDLYAAGTEDYVQLINPFLNRKNNRNFQKFL